MQAAALIIVILFGLWLVWSGLVMAVRPDWARAYIGTMASTWRINLAEQGLRLLAGIALVARADESRVTSLLGVAGWILILSSIALLVVPLRWHSGYARFWAGALRPWMLRLLAPVSCAAGLGLIWAAW